MNETELHNSLKQALLEHDSLSARILLRRLINLHPSLVNAQLVLTHSKEIGFDLPRESFKAAFLRAYTVEPLLPIIQAFAVTGGINLEIRVGNFNTYVQDVLDDDGWLYSFGPQVVIFALQCRDILPEIWNSPLQIAPNEVPPLVERALEGIRGWIRKIREKSDASVMLPTIDAPIFSSGGILDFQNPLGQRCTIDRFNSGLRELAAATPGVWVLDIQELTAVFGRVRCYDERKWNAVRFPFSAEMIPDMSKEYAKYIHVLSGKISKVLAVDLDNTLWGGVVGEDGIDGLKIGTDSEGLPFHNLQHALLDLYHRGIALAICSKNNFEDAIVPIETHPGMVLRSKHFAAIRINWEDKARNLREIAKELNLGLDSVAFLDDNPVERERISRELPEVQVIDLPDDPSRFATIIRQCPSFERLSLSEEDRVRGRYFAEDRERRLLQEKTDSLEDFYRSLVMEAEIDSVDSQSVKRVAQLTQKTNQFNLTTRRYTEQQVLAMTERPDWRVYATKACDRFGDNGLVGVTIAQIQDSACEIDTFLLSCRVIGRMLEKAMLAHIAYEARSHGVRFLRGWFIPTAKNKPASEFYRDNGFQIIEQRPDGWALWQLDLCEVIPEWPKWIKCKTVMAQSM